MTVSWEDWAAGECRAKYATLGWTNSILSSIHCFMLSIHFSSGWPYYLCRKTDPFIDPWANLNWTTLVYIKCIEAFIVYITKRCSHAALIFLLQVALFSYLYISLMCSIWYFRKFSVRFGLRIVYVPILYFLFKTDTH